MTRRQWFAGAITITAFGAGCSGGSAPRLTLSDAAFLTEEALSELLFGTPPDEGATRPTPPAPPLLRRGVYEEARIAADAASFASVSRGALKGGEVRLLQKQVVDNLHKEAARRGFAVTLLPNFPPPSAVPEKTLLVTLTPATEDAGSPEDKAKGAGRTLVLFRLTVTNAKGEILARRDYYSGRDAGASGKGSRLRLKWR